MKVEWFGHSCFKLTESTGTSVVTDPYAESIGYGVPELTADIVTISHDHYDHNNKHIVKGNPKIINTQKSFEYNGITISSFRSFHDDEEGSKRGKNLIFKYRIDGIDVCHLGDIGEECNSQIVDLLLPVNVLLIPIGGKYTIDAEKAKEYVDRLMPDFVIPMHFRTRSHTIRDIDKLEPFLNLFDEENIIKVEDDYIVLDRNDLDSEITKVIVLDRKK